MIEKLKLAGIGLVFLFFMFGGISHFTNPGFFLAIMPPYIPFHEAAVAVSGFFEILGALGLLLPRTRRMAGLGLFALTIAVSPANIYMWMEPGLFPDVTPLFLSLRLVAQVLLLSLIWWSTLPVAVEPDATKAAENH